MDLALASILVSVAMTLISGLMGWLLKSSFDRIAAVENENKSLQAQIGAVRELLHERFVRRDDFKDLGDNIFEALRRIETKLDGKADKP
jgi:hypothetical protein